MAQTCWYNGNCIENAGQDETIQALLKQPYFMLECSRISGASYIREICKKDIPDITSEGYLYLIDDEQKNIVLHKNCTYLLGVFNLDNKRIYQLEYDEIKEKSRIWHEIYNKIKNNEACITYQNIVQSFLDPMSDEYKKSLDLLANFKNQFDDLKKKIANIEKEIERMILEYIYKELRLLIGESSGINIQGTLKHYLDFFMN